MSDICLAENSTSGGVQFYSSIAGQYYQTRQDCLTHEVVMIGETPVQMTRQDLTVMTGFYGAFLGVVIFAVLYKAIT